MFEKEIKSIARKYEIDPDLVTAIIKVESNFRPFLKTKEVSKKGKFIGFSYGLMQVLDSTARIFKVKNPNLLLNPIINITVGTMYLRDLTDRYKKLDLVIASYNAGRPKLVRTGALPFQVKFINQGYVDKVKKELSIIKMKKLLPLVFSFAVGWFVYGKGKNREEEGVKSSLIELIRPK